jgi:hypothetical protein
MAALVQFSPGDTIGHLLYQSDGVGEVSAVESLCQVDRHNVSLLDTKIAQLKPTDDQARNNTACTNDFGPHRRCREGKIGHYASTYIVL